jgi:hypothetical protein
MREATDLAWPKVVGKRRIDARGSATNPGSSCPLLCFCRYIHRSNPAGSKRAGGLRDAGPRDQNLSHSWMRKDGKKI